MQDHTLHLFNAKFNIYLHVTSSLCTPYTHIHTHKYQSCRTGMEKSQDPVAEGCILARFSILQVETAFAKGVLCLVGHKTRPDIVLEEWICPPLL